MTAGKTESLSEGEVDSLRQELEAVRAENQQLHIKLGNSENELGKKRADVGLAKKLHSMRPGYARLGLGINKADSNARTRIDEIKAKLTAESN